MSADFRLGRWEDVLQDVECDALIVDAPYSERTHAAQKYARKKDPRYHPNTCLTSRGLSYVAFSEADVSAFVDHWSPRTRGWFVTITDHVLAPIWHAHLARHGRTVFAPLACVRYGMNCRLAGDGPSNWTCWAVVARPRSLHRWGTLPGAYVGGQDQDRKRAGFTGEGTVHGAKPAWLMRALVRDYSRPGDLVCDPCAGGATTLVAARSEGRRGVGAEMDETHYRLGRLRLSRGYTPPLFLETRSHMEQLVLAEADG